MVELGGAADPIIMLPSTATVNVRQDLPGVLPVRERRERAILCLGW